ncbi:uncharacterized protein ELE39_003564 [Cryptosporidium sp. chipmunk genotype I]|uniref:uncharacterized protein n=1 Tax=Cryptosporidium sp. chipmunk genotype I TaxID=1280935 RepID=UPI00351AAA9B|nr:hypothetical protein ELE39_003564 [Cryptosporidium sp. chipmunk genotype I]
MRLLYLLSVLITYLLIIYVASATELGSTQNAVPISQVGAPENSTEKSDGVDSDGASTTEDLSETSGTEEAVPVITSELDSQPVDSSEQEDVPVPTSTEELDLGNEPEADLYTAEIHSQDEVEDSYKQSEELTPLEEASEYRDEASEVKDDVLEVKDDVLDVKDEASEVKDEVSTAAELSGDETEQTSDEQVTDLVEKADKDQEETQESLVVHQYEVPLKFVCETKKLICHGPSSSNTITIQGSRKGSALFASFDSSMIKSSGLTSGDVVSATLVLNKIGGTRTLPVRVDVLNLESKSSRISKSTVLATYQTVLPKTQNSPVGVDITSAIRELLDNAKDHEKFSILVSAYSKTRFGDILTFPTKDYPNGLTLELKVTKLPENPSDPSDSTAPVKEVQSLKDRVFSGQNLYVAMGILATVLVIVIVLMMM